MLEPLRSERTPPEQHADCNHGTRLSDPVHLAATEAACDLDRDRFTHRPELRRYVRPALEHEFCGYVGCCIPMAHRSVSVIHVGGGLRVRTLL